MTARTHVSRSTLVLAAFALTAALLGGCSSNPTAGTPGGSPGVSEGSGTSGPDGTPNTTADDFPSCDEVKAVLGPEVGGLIELEDTDNGIQVGDEGPFLACAWHTPATAAAGPDLEEYGGVAVGISIDREYTEESMESLGWNVEDARVEAADAWGLKVGGGYNPQDQLDAIGVQVVRDRDGVVVAITAGGVVLQDVPELAALTNDWALGAGVAMLELMN